MPDFNGKKLTPQYYSAMDQSETLDLILKTLYERPGKRGHLVLFMREKGVTLTIEEAYNLGQTLGQDHYVLYKPTLDDVSLALTTEGIAFMESSSFAEPGVALIERVINPKLFFFNEESGLFTISIETGEVSAANQILGQIKQVIGHDQTVDEETRQAITDCTRAVEYGIAGGVAFNGYNLQTFLELAADIPSIASLAQQLPGLFK